MITEKMTIHQALCEVKLADKKISQMLSSGRDFNLIGINKNPDSTKPTIDGIDVNTFSETAKADYQKITDIFKRVDAIKAAVSKSNANTKLVVAGKEMSVAEAIYHMKYGIKNKKKYMPVMVDPIKIQDEINKLSDEIDKFEMNVDSAIQVSNATTTIEIEY